MREIRILDKTYAELEKIIKDIQPEQIKRYGKPVVEAPEDMIPYLIGYYHANEELQAKRRAKLQENTERIQKEIEDLKRKWNLGSS